MIVNNFDFKTTKKHIQISTILKMESIQFFWSIVSRVTTITKEDCILRFESQFNSINKESFRTKFDRLSIESQINLFCKTVFGGQLDDFINRYLDDLYQILKPEISKHVWIRGDLIVYMTLDAFLIDFKERLSLPFSKQIIQYYFKENDIDDLIELDITQQLELYRLCCPIRL